MEKQYVLTDGIRFIKVSNQDNNPSKVSYIEQATIFNSVVSANNFLLSPQMEKLNRDCGKRKFNIDEIEGVHIMEKIEQKSTMDDDIISEIQELDGTFKDFEEFKSADKYNRHIYTGRTVMEEDGFDMPEFMKQAITVFSQLENYVENMAYLEQEVDLKILDLRHFKRDEETRLNAVEAQSLEYYEQELERDRIEYKKTRLLGL
jgi:hypothetical protein